MNRTYTTALAVGVALMDIASCSDPSSPNGLTTDDLTADANRVVAAIQVHLASDSIAAGATTQATVTMQDRRGRPIDRPVQWSSSDVTIASVSDSGLVRGLKAGRANVIARYQTVSGQAALQVGPADSTVSPPPPPPPPPPPSSGTLLFQENFEDANIASRGWYDNTSVQISTAEHISGSVASAQYHWLQGASTPTSGGAQRHRFTPTNSVYISYYVKYSTNYLGSGQLYHPHEFYLLSNLDGDYDGPSNSFLDVYIEQNYQNGGKPVIAVQDNRSINTTYGVPHNLVGVTENRSTSGCNGIAEANMPSECYNTGSSWYNDKRLTGPVVFQPVSGAGYKSNWNFVEAYVQLNSIVNGVGQADGVIQYWFNGALVIDRHDVMFRTGYRPTLQFSQLLIAPYIGDGSPVDQSMWIDNLRIATGRIP